jgi:hypothetical protein
VTFTIWGGQYEAGTVASSHIPTLAATVTRAADQVNVTPASINYSATAGSWWVDLSLNAFGAGGTDRIIGYQAGSNTPIYVGGGTAFQIYDGVSNISRTVGSVLGLHKLAVAFASGDRALTADGLAVSTDASAGAAFLSPGTNIFFGNNIGADVMTGYLRKLRYLPRRPSNAELVTMTA